MCGRLPAHLLNVENQMVFRAGTACCAGFVCPARLQAFAKSNAFCCRRIRTHRLRRRYARWRSFLTEMLFLHSTGSLSQIVFR
jgi:hypothetical protein